MTDLTTAQREAIAQVQCPVCDAPPHRSCGMIGSPRRAPHPARLELAKRYQQDRAKLAAWRKQ